ncbi:hypothetical protein [Streptomyces sp. NPDC055400]
MTVTGTARNPTATTQAVEYGQPLSRFRRARPDLDFAAPLPASGGGIQLRRTPLLLLHLAALHGPFAQQQNCWQAAFVAESRMRRAGTS